MAAKPAKPGRKKSSLKTVESADAWATYDPDYNVGKFYTRATDNRGHGDHVRITAPPDFTTLVSKLIQSGAIPEYATAQDFWRDAGVHRMQYLNDQNNLPESERPLYQMIMANNELAEIKRRQALRQSFVNDVVEVSQSRSSGKVDRERVIDLVARRLPNFLPEDHETIFSELREHLAAPVFDQIKDKIADLMEGGFGGGV